MSKWISLTANTNGIEDYEHVLRKGGTEEDGTFSLVAGIPYGMLGRRF